MEKSYGDIFEGILAKNPTLVPSKLLSLQNRLLTRYGHKAVGALRYLPLVGRFLPEKEEKQVLIETLKQKQKTATSYRQWHEILTQLDELLGNNTWKVDPQLDVYDYDMLFRSLEELREARLAKDHRRVLYIMRTKWTRNVANMGDIHLYRHTHVGTKKLIEEYVQECQDALDFLVEQLEGEFDDQYLLGMLIQTRKNIGRTALLLSGGLTFGISHIGVLMTLLEKNLLPRIISGSSSGSLVASILCCNNNEEMRVLLGGMTELQFNIFGKLDPKESGLKLLLGRVSHFLKYGTVFDIKGLQESIRNLVGDLTFREAYNRTGKILNITVSPASAHEQTRLLNYLTAPNCLIWLAVSASCSLPGIFPLSLIYEKNPRTNEIHEWNNDILLKYVDGSLDGDLPILRLSEMFNVDHIIAVQVNPHVLPVLHLSVGSAGWFDGDFSEVVRSIMNNCYDFVVSEIIHYLQIIHEMDILKNLTMKVISVLSQRYSGDITILPQLEMADFVKIFSNPLPEFLLDFVLRGARAAWPKMSLIHNHCGVEFKLDLAILTLRGRLVASANNRIGYSRLAGADLVRKSENSPYWAALALLRLDSSPPGEYPLSAVAKTPQNRKEISWKDSKGKSTTALHSLSLVRSDLRPKINRSLTSDLRNAQSFHDVSSPGSPVSFRVSPKHDKTVHSDSYDDLAHRLGLEKTRSEPQISERPNLPKLKNSSSAKLDVLDQNFKSLGSKDLRRLLRKEKRKPRIEAIDSRHASPETLYRPNVVFKELPIENEQEKMLDQFSKELKEELAEEVEKGGIGLEYSNGKRPKLEPSASEDSQNEEFFPCESSDFVGNAS